MSIICYDNFSGRYFVSSINELRSVETILRMMLQKCRRVTINNVYNLLKLDDVIYGDRIGWQTSVSIPEDSAIWHYYNFFEIFEKVQENGVSIVLLVLTCGTNMVNDLV